MNKHTKLAFFVAPILLILGYIGSDLYMENQADKTRVFPLQTEGVCDVIAQSCVLTSGEFKINVFDEDGITTINSTFPLDSAVLFLVDDEDKTEAFPLGMNESPYYWKSPTPLRANINTIGTSQKLRLIASIKGGKYISEFESITE